MTLSSLQHVLRVAQGIEELSLRELQARRGNAGKVVAKPTTNIPSLQIIYHLSIPHASVHDLHPKQVHLLSVKAHSLHQICQAKLDEICLNLCAASEREGLLPRSVLLERVREALQSKYDRQISEWVKTIVAANRLYLSKNSTSPQADGKTGEASQPNNRPFNEVC
jgi:hypothetical protein